MPNSGILLISAIALSPADAALNPGESITFAGTGGSGAYAFTLESPSGGTIDPVSGIYTAGAGALEDVDDVVTLTDDRGDVTTATIHVRAETPSETPTGVPRHSVNIAGGGPADNECDCGVVGSRTHGGERGGRGGLVATVAVGLLLFSRRRRID